MIRHRIRPLQTHLRQSVSVVFWRSKNSANRQVSGAVVTLNAVSEFSMRLMRLSVTWSSDGVQVSVFRVSPRP